MEDLILILQGLAEFIFEVFAYWPWDLFSYRRGTNDQMPSVIAFLVLTVGTGVLLGWLSLMVFPSVLIKWAWLRVALLFISPLLSGTVGYLMAARRAKQGLIVEPWFHFWVSLCFSFGLVAARFALAHRPA